MSGDGVLEEVVRRTVKLALQKGAAGAECTAAEGDESSTSVRKGNVETLKQTRARSAGLRVLLGRQAGSAYTSDVTGEGIDRMVRSALELASTSTEDPHAGLPEEGEFGSIPGDLQLYSSDIDDLTTETKVEMARAAEDAAFAADPRIVNSEGGSFDTYGGRRVFANSRGFFGSYRSSSCSVSVAPIAQDGDSRERDYWFSASRSFAGLESPVKVGEVAAMHAVRRLRARPVKTQKASLVFEPRSAMSLLDNLFDAFHGEMVYHRTSFLADRLGEQVASKGLTVVDDGTIPGLFGTSPFDDEGVPSRRTVIIENGVLKNYLLNTYTARKLGMRTTGNASRGVGGHAGIGHGNLFIEEGTAPAEDIVRSVNRGLYVTELSGFGVNIVTGDYSRRAVGLWIENGELAYPVSEVTIVGNLHDVLLNIEAVGSDLEFRGSIAAPTLLVREMSIRGH